MRDSDVVKVGDIGSSTEFVVGPCNREAVEAADLFFDLVSGDPRAQPPVVLLAGPSGVGKTHLLLSLVNRLQGAAVGLGMLTGAELLDETVEMVRFGRLRDDVVGREGQRVVMVDGLESLAAPTEAALEAMWRLRRTVADGSALVVAETTAATSSATPATAKLRRMLRSDQPVCHIQPLDHETRRELIRRESTRRGLELTERTISVLDGDHLTSGASVKGMVARLDAQAVDDPSILELDSGDLEGRRGRAEDRYVQRLLLNVSRSLAGVPQLSAVSGHTRARTCTSQAWV